MKNIPFFVVLNNQKFALSWTFRTCSGIVFQFTISFVIRSTVRFILSFLDLRFLYQHSKSTFQMQLQKVKELYTCVVMSMATPLKWYHLMARSSKLRETCAILHMMQLHLSWRVRKTMFYMCENRCWTFCGRNAIRFDFLREQGSKW